MFVVIPEATSLNIYRYGLYEEDLTKTLLYSLKHGMVFFDIGAHYGYYTLLASFLVGEEGQVHSFEPTPYSFDVLKLNAKNKINIILNNCAVYSTKKNLIINDYGIQYSAFNSIYNARLPKIVLQNLKSKKLLVESISIDEYVERTCIVPDFIKIDAESSEYEILIGMEKTIKKFYPKISFEVGDMDVHGVPKS